MGFESILLAAAEGDSADVNYLPLILDVVAIVFLLIFMIRGYKKGFLKELVGLIGTIVAFFIAFSFAAPLADFLESQFGLTTMLSGWVEGILNGIEVFEVPLSGESLNNALDVLILPSFLKDTIQEILAGVQYEEGAVTIAQMLSPIFAGFLVSLICGIVLFIVSSVVLELLANVLSSILDKIPLLGGLNRLLGFLLGGVRALIYLYIILGVLSFLPFEELHECLKQTVFINWLVENNLIMLVFQQLFSSENLMETVQGFIDGLLGGGNPPSEPAVVA